MRENSKWCVIQIPKLKKPGIITLCLVITIIKFNTHFLEANHNQVKIWNRITPYIMVHIFSDSLTTHQHSHGDMKSALSLKIPKPWLWESSKSCDHQRPTPQSSLVEKTHIKGIMHVRESNTPTHALLCDMDWLKLQILPTYPDFFSKNKSY